MKDLLMFSQIDSFYQKELLKDKSLLDDIDSLLIESNMIKEKKVAMGLYPEYIKEIT